MPKVQEEINGANKEPFEKRKVDISFCSSLGVLVRRDILNTVRNPMLLKTRIISTIFIAIYTSGLYFDINSDYTNRTNWRSLTGYLFFISISIMMLALNPITLVFPSERAVFLKE